MKKLLQIGLLLVAGCQFTFAQQLIVNGEIEMNGGTAVSPLYIVVNNPATNAVVSNSGGFIYSEGEFNMLLWNIGVATGSYTVPFGYSSSLYLPVTLNIGTAGTGSGVVKFSTYNTAALNSALLPSDVTNVNPFITPGDPSGTDDSYKIVDRFYIIDANTGYTTKPTPSNITFSYIAAGGSSDVAGLNSITQANLMGERFNSTSDTWSDWFGYGCTDLITGNTATVQTGPVPATDLYRSWALWDNLTPLPLQLTAQNILCGGTATGSASVTVSGGQIPYTYLWEPGGQTGSTASSLLAGTYTVNVQDNSGCISTASISITQTAQLSVSASSTGSASCSSNSGSASSSVTGGATPYTYAWTGGGSNPTISNLSAGTYTISVTDNNDCSASASVTITQSSGLSVSVTIDNIMCFGTDDGSVLSSVSGGTPPFIYSWSNGGLTHTITGLSAGTYSVSITDKNGCSGTASATVTQPASAVSVSIASQTAISCGVSGSATANPATGGVGPYTYTWTPNGGSNLTASNLTAGNYTITAEDNNGCSGTAGVTILQPSNVPAISVTSQTNIVCFGDFGSATVSAATGGTSPYTYSWSPSGGSGLTATGLSAGNYTITVTDNLGCAGFNYVTITGASSPLAISIAGQTGISCGVSATATANPATGGVSPYTYTWTPDGGSNIEASNLTAGNYTITVEDFNGCSATAGVTITEPSTVPALSITSQTNIVCLGDLGSATASAATGGTAPYTYAWSPSGGNGLTATGLSAGNYTITVTDNVGCTGFNYVTISSPTNALATSVTSESVLCFGTMGTATANTTGGVSPYTYSWTPSGGNNATATGLSAGNYTITVQDNSGCANTASITITAPTSAVAISIANQTAISCGVSASATANPATGGVSPYTYTWSPSGGNGLTASNLTAGNYTITVQDHNGCSATAGVTIVQPANVPAISVTSQTNIVCFGDFGSASVSAATGGTAPYTYAWSPSGGNGLTATGLSAGNYTITVTDNLGCAGFNYVTITGASSALAISIASQTGISCGASASATANAATGGVSPYTYTWTPNGGSNLTASNLTAGNYTITVEDFNGCSATAGVTITQPANVPALSIASQTNIQCFGDVGSATANAATGGTAPYTYSWSPSGGTNLTANGLSAGNYTITVTDNTGCTGFNYVTITGPTMALTTTLTSQNVLCFGSVGNATANVTGGTAPYTYTWSPSGGNNANASLTAGNYTITVEDFNGCGTTNTVTITAPAAAVAISIASQTGISCGVSGSATANAATGGTAPYTYSWSPSGGNGLTASNLTAGTYVITAEDNNGCTAMASVTITQPSNVPAISVTSQTNVACFGDLGSATVSVATGGTAPYTYAWTPSGGNGLTATGLSAGNYTITVTDNLGCTGFNYVTITGPSSALAISIASQTGIACGVSATATANAATGGTSPYTYTWSPSGGNSLTGSNLTAGNYTITVEDHNGCSATAGVTITQPANVPFTSIVSHTNVTCFGDLGSATASAATGGTAPYTYAWSPSGGNGLTATGLSAGNYTITVTDNLGCAGFNYVTITGPTSALTASVTSQNILCFGSTGNATANTYGGTSPYTYTWSPSGGNNAIASDLSAGNYTVTIKDHNGCSTTASVTITAPASAVAISIASQTAISCGVSGSATANPATGGVGTYTYTWTPNGGNGLTASNLTAGNYTITAEDKNGCSGTAGVTIIQPSNVPFISVTSQTNIVCFGDLGSATVSAATGGTAPYTYAWSPSGGNGLTATGLSAGNYTITVTDNIGCAGFNYVTITGASTPLAISIASQTGISCGVSATATANPATGGVPPYTYVWTPDGGSNLEASDLTAGNYTITIEDYNGCSATAGVTITQPANVPALSILSNTNVMCFGDVGSATASAATGGTAPYMYNWTPSGGTDLTANGLSAGSYTITVTDHLGCTGFNYVTITGPTSALATSVTSQNILCFGETGNASANVTGGTSPYTYSWTGGGATSSITGLSAGTYTLGVMDNNGCGNTASVTITAPASAVAISIASQTGISCGVSGSATASPATGGISPYTYNWSPSGGNGLTASNLTAGSYTITVQDNNGCSATAGVTITQPANVPFTSITSHTNIMCFGDLGSATASAATGGTAPYTYAWTPSGGNGLAATGLSAGNYTITVTDNTGCQGFNYVTITGPSTALSITMASHTGIACGTSATATANPATGGVSPYTYTWSPDGGSNRTASDLSAGNYTITVQDNNGCSATAGISITQPANVPFTSITAHTNVMCFGDLGSATASAATGGTAPYTYSWSPSGGTGLTATGLSAGNYTITVTDNTGCIGYNYVTIAGPSSALAINIAGQTAISCGVSATATANPATGGVSPYTYTWTPDGGSNLTASNLTAGNYTITVQDQNGCSATAGVSIVQPSNVPFVSVTAQTNVQCFGDIGSATVSAATGGTAPYTYNWTPSGGTGLTATGLSAGNYTLTVTDNTGCAGYNYVTITGPTSALNSSVTGQNVMCFGDKGSASATTSGGTSPYTYSWTGGSTSSSITGLSAGTYTVGVTDHNGCTYSTSVTITTPVAAVGITINTHTNVVCNDAATGTATGNTATGGTGPYTYKWTPSGGTNLTASDLSAGTYTITTTDHNGCTATASVVITQAAAMVITTYTVDATPGACNGIAAVHVVSGGAPPYTYSWNTTPVSTTDTIKKQCAKEYCCTVTDHNGCTESTCVTIATSTTGIDGINNASNISIYPDPTIGSFTIAGVTQGQVIELYNALGQKLSSVTVSKTTMYFDISDKANGIYLIRILNTDGTLATQKKLVKTQ